VEYTSVPSVGHFVSSLAEAQREAGFETRLPQTLVEQVASGLAVVKVLGPVDARLRIHVNDLMAALKRRGIDGVNVPQSWDGVEIGHHLGHSIVIVFLGGTLGEGIRPALITAQGLVSLALAHEYREF